MSLEELGWNERLSAEFEPHRARRLEPGRVAAEHRNEIRLYTEAGEIFANVAGRLRHHARGPADLPVVGDWIVYKPLPGEERGTVQAVLGRSSCFSRKAVGAKTQEQVIAANVDTLFVVSALDGEVNPRRLERYLALAWESGAAPVLALTKADLCENPEARVEAARAVAGAAPVHAVNGRTGEGVEELRQYLSGSRTGAMVGSSGVGKSTLINRLAGHEAQRTAEVREDGKGRHTTVHRELLRIPGGGLLIDTPGMRELQMWDSGTGLADAFSDILELGTRCRFTDCRHENEPGCAVAAALANGALDSSRFENFRKLQAELKHLDQRQDQRAKLEAKRATVARQRGLNTQTRRNPKR